jgi:predicted dehydrogenase
MGGGVLMDVGVHYFRAVRLLMGEPDRVFATRAQQINTKMGGEDSVQVLLSSRLGWQAHLLMSWSSPRGHSPDILVSGERGILQIWPGDPYLELYPAEPRLLTELVSYIRPAWLGEKLMRPTFQRVRLPVPDADKIGYLTEIREFLAAVTEGRQPATVPMDARRDLEIVLRAYESLRAESWAEIERCPVSPT